MPINIPAGSYVLPLCFDSPDALADLINYGELWRDLREGGIETETLTEIYEAIDSLLAQEDSPCLETSSGSLGSCYRMDTTTEVFDFYPNNPFDSSDDSKTAIGMSWTRLEDIVSQEFIPDWLTQFLETFGDLIGYFPNDCFISYNPLSDINLDFSSFWDFVNSLNIFPFPTVTFKVQGTGQLEIEFAQVPLGGRVLVTWDFLPAISDIEAIANGNFEGLNNFQLLEINMDLIPIPTELVSSIVTEIEFTEDIEHTVRCFFIPIIDVDQFPFIFPFGGIREIEFCGNLKVIGAQTDTVYDKNNYKFEQASRSGFIMTTFEDMREAVRQGNNLSKEDIARRILLAQDGNIENPVELGIGTGSEITVKTGSVTGGSFDGTAKSDEVIYGAAMGVGEGFRDIVAEIILRRGNQALSAELVAQRLRYTYVLIPIVEGVDAIVDLLGTPYQQATDEVTPTVIPEAIANIVFCQGASRQALNQYALDIADSGTTDAQHISDWYLALIEGITDEQIQAWFDKGLKTPRAGYQNAPCSKKPTQTYVLDNPAASKHYPFDYLYYRPRQAVAKSA